MPLKAKRMTGWTGWLVWWGLLATWTFALLTPHPVRVTGLHLSLAASLVVAKTSHLVAYAVLAGLLFWLPLRPSWRWGLLALLSLHGCGTEILQLLVVSRNGSFRDVVIDHVGIGLGWLLAWWFCHTPSRLHSGWQGRANGLR